MNVQTLFAETLFQIGDKVRILPHAFAGSDDIFDMLAIGEIAEIVDIQDTGIGEDYNSETLYYVKVLDYEDLYTSPIDSELELIAAQGAEGE